MHIYIRKLFPSDVDGHQISFTKDVALNFFNASSDFMDRKTNVSIHVFHFNNKTDFRDIELQPATDYRFSTVLNHLLTDNQGDMHVDDLLYCEKIGRGYGVKLITTTHPQYETFNALLNEKDRHFLLCMDDEPGEESHSEGTESLSSLNDEPEEKKFDSKYRPYITAIKSKPFLLLAGISGTGKSRIVRELARACWPKGSDEYNAHKPKNFEMIQVRPNWHDSSELIGYVSRIGADRDGNGVTYVPGDFLRFIIKAWEDLKTPYFVCLDEMNLAPVEQYFAEYLSVIESRQKDGDHVVTDPILYSDEKWFVDLIQSLSSSQENIEMFKEKGVSIPENLIVVGTVNMDETTFSFSRKVLDRAMTIEMNEVLLDGGLVERHENLAHLTRGSLIGTNVEGIDVYSDYKAECDVVIDYLKSINSILENTPFKVAYRTRNEFLLYIVNNLSYNQQQDGSALDKNIVLARALDEITSMKILSRIEGDETKVSEKFLNELSQAIHDKLLAISGKDFVYHKPELVDDGLDVICSVSMAKLHEMTKKLSFGYTSFWN